MKIGVSEAGFGLRSIAQRVASAESCPNRARSPAGRRRGRIRGSRQPRSVGWSGEFLTRSGTLANQKGFVESRGGVAVPLTGKPYSAKLVPSPDTLRALRYRHGSALEN